MRRQIGLILIAVVLPSVLAGCWTRREIETVGFVTAVGIDRTEDGSKVRLTLHIAKPFAMMSGTNGQATQERPFWVVTTEGATVFEAAQNLQVQSPRKPFWSHNRFILIGESAARQGLQDVLDWFIRNGETRRLAEVIVLQGGTAWDLLQVEFELERMPAEGGRGISIHVERELSYKPPHQTLHEFSRRLEQQGIEPVSTLAHVIVRQEDDPSLSGKLAREQVVTSGSLAGMGVFRGYNLVGFFNEREALGFNWITGQVQRTLLVTELPGHPGTLCSFQVTDATGKIQVKIDGNRAAVQVHIKAEASLQETQTELDFLKEPQLWDALESKLEDAILKDCQQALSKAKDLGSDVFGFGREICRKDPQSWAQVRDSWADIFRECEVQFNIDAQLKRSGLSVRSLQNR